MSSKSHKWAANIERIIGYTKLFLTLLLKFFPLLQSLDPLHAYDGKSCILSELSQAKEPEPQRPLERIADRKKHLGERQYIEQHTETQHYESCAERKSGKPPLGLPDK